MPIYALGYSSLWQPFNVMIDCVYTTYVLIHVFLDVVILHSGALQFHD